MCNALLFLSNSPNTASFQLLSSTPEKKKKKSLILFYHSPDLESQLLNQLTQCGILPALVYWAILIVEPW